MGIRIMALLPLQCSLVLMPTLKKPMPLPKSVKQPMVCSTGQLTRDHLSPLTSNLQTWGPPAWGLQAHDLQGLAVSMRARALSVKQLCCARTYQEQWA